MAEFSRWSPGSDNGKSYLPEKKLRIHVAHKQNLDWPLERLISKQSQNAIFKNIVRHQTDVTGKGILPQ